MFHSRISARSLIVIISTPGLWRIAFALTGKACGISVFQPNLPRASSTILQMFHSSSTNPSSSTGAEAEEDAAVGLQDIGISTRKDNIYINTDPTIRSWKSRMDESIAKSRKIRGGNYVQLATVATVLDDDDGSSNHHYHPEPRCRTVVFRGFQKNMPAALAVVDCGDDDDDDSSGSSSCVMKMITDARSNKVTREELKHAELVWWFAKTNEQYRIRGELVYVGPGHPFEHDTVLATARKEQWGNLSDKAREQFFWQEPGIPYHGESSIIPTGGRDEEGVLLPAPNTFLLVLLLPRRCEYLRLTDNYRQIDELVAGHNDRWKRQRVNP